MPFTYLVGWSSINRFYYGVRYGKKSTPDTLWTTYFTSSKDVKEHREKFGEPDVVQVRKLFESPEKAIRWEFKVLRRLKAASSVKWLNRREAPAIPTFSGAANPMFGRNHKTSTLQILSEKAKARRMNADQLLACSERNSGERNPFFGKTHTPVNHWTKFVGLAQIKEEVGVLLLNRFCLQILAESSLSLQVDLTHFAKATA